MNRYTMPAHWFTLRHLEALWNGTHPFLSSDLTPKDEGYEDTIFPDIAKAISQAIGGQMPSIVASAIVAFLIVMLEQITIPEDELESVVNRLKHIYSQEPTEKIGVGSKENLQSLISRLSSTAST